MSFFDVLNLIGGLSLFLFGMHVMGTALEKRAGGQLKALLGKLTGSKLAGFLTGLGVTAVIQSSSATTVMVVGFVNSGLMTLKQAIHVIMGANVGTTVTAWLLSLAGLDGSSLFIQLLKPSSFTPVLALVGIVLIMAGKERQKDTGSILLGFAVLMYGMEAMSGAVSPLRTSESFRSLLLLFSNPILGVLAGAVFTAIIQSSSASVGVLTGACEYGRHYDGVGNSDHHGSEHRHLRDRDALFHRRKHERKARRRGPLKLQHHRYGSDARCLLRGARNASARIFVPSCHGSDHCRCAFAL